MKKVLAFIIIIFFGLNFFAKVTYASDLSLLSNLNNPNVLIFLDTSGSMMWNEGVNWSGSGTSGYDAPESWAAGGKSPIWAPESDSVFSKIYNAKLAIGKIVTDPSFSNFNFAFATFYQSDPSTNYCIYSSDSSFTNPAGALYYPGSNGGTGTPDETGAYLSNPNYPFIGDYYVGSYCTNNANLQMQTGQTCTYTCSKTGNSCTSNSQCTGRRNYCTNKTCTPIYTTDYFVSYGYPSNSNNGSWMLYVPSTTNGSLSDTTSTTVNSNPNNSTDPYFDPASIAGPAINWLLWTAPVYGSGATDPAGNPIIGLKADGDTPTYGAAGNIIKYFTNSLQKDANSTCRRNFSIIITDGEANDNNASQTPNELYQLYGSVDTTFPIETFMIGFGYSGNLGGPTYIQQMANAGAGIDPSTNPGGVSFTATVGNTSTVLSLPSSAFSTENGILIGDTVSDNGNQSSDCEKANNNSGTYANGNDCAVVTGVYPSTDSVLLSNSLKTLTSGSGSVNVTGTVYLTFNYSQLVSSLTAIFSQIAASTDSFTTPVIHQVQGQNSNVYYTYFKSLNQPLWGEGNIVLFKLNSQNQLIGPSGSATDSNGNIITSNSYWDGGAGTGGLLQAESPGSRYIITGNLDSSTGLISTVPFDTANDIYLEPLLGLTAANYSSVCPGSASESTCADNIINFVLNPDSSTDNWKLGAIFHAMPVMVSTPPFPYSSASYQQFKTQYATTQPRQQVLVAGANDGMLHGFDAGTWNSSSNYYTDGTGAELFGYIPPDFLNTNGSSVLPKITQWYESSVAIPSVFEFVDSTPEISDVFFGNVFDGTVNSVNPSYQITNGSSASSWWNSWHTVLIGGEQDGGTSYYALDLTDPSKVGSAYPVPLWDFSDASASTDPMGDTWSQPSINFVCLPNPNYVSGSGSAGAGLCGNNPNPPSPFVAPQYVETYAAFVGGGYSSDNTAGQAVYALYAEPNPVNTAKSGSTPVYVNEQELWKFTNSKMQYSIPSAVSPVTSGTFMLEAFYVGDLGGQMWAFNIPTGAEPSKWTGCVLFASSQSSPPLNIFFQPAISYDSANNLWLFFGTGNRENLSGVNTRDNEFIGINTAGTNGIGQCANGGAYSESDLTLEISPSGIGSVPSGSDGWYINLSSGEKVVGAPQVYNNIVYFTTFTPSAVTNACGNGTAKLYAVYYLNGGGTITVSGTTITISNTVTSGASQSTTIGTGVPSAPVISNGTLIVTTSSGAVLTQKIPSRSSSLMPTSWFQLP